MLEVNDKNFKEEVLESDIVVLVDFYAIWCAPCKKILPIIEEIAKQYKGKVKVCKLNVDDSPKTASEYTIMSIPTLVIFKDGKVQETIVGVVQKSEIEKRIESYIQ
jgi:thioredoxin 1